MRFLEAIPNLLPWLGTFTRLVQQARRVVEMARKLLMRPQTSYENLLLELTLDIKDPQGRQAVLKRVQRVRFLTEESGVVRDLVWGEGNPMARYGVLGARRLGVMSEGSRRVVLLGLSRRPTRGEVATITSRRLIRGAFTGTSGYLEALAERPTRRLAMKVLFPRTRPPKSMHLVSSPATQVSRRLRLGYEPDRRASLRWARRRPEPDRIYSLQWTW